MPLLASIATLFDQPLSALDLAIRLEMEEELRRLHREVGATFIYVTHDQREALAISDRIAILNSGRIEQLGTPSEIYRRPSSPFAARFVGGANVIPVEIAPQGEAQISISIGVHRLALPSSGLDGGAAWLVLRPEAIRLSATPGSNGCALEGRVQDFAYRGSAHAYRVEVPGLPEPLKVEVAAEGISPFPVGSIVWIGWEASSNLFLPRTR